MPNKKHSTPRMLVRARKHARTVRATYAAFGEVAWRSWMVASFRGSLWARSVRYGVLRHPLRLLEARRAVPRKVRFATNTEHILRDFKSTLESKWRAHRTRLDAVLVTRRIKSTISHGVSEWMHGN